MSAAVPPSGPDPTPDEPEPVPPLASTASLRVFVPLSTLPSGERRRWERYVAAGRAPDRAGLVAAERAAAVLAAVRPSLDVDVEQALVEIVDGVTYICPARTQLRVWEAAEAFRDGLPDIVADAFVPPGLAAEAADQLAGWREVSPGLLPHIRSASWTIPLAWFLVFEAAERQPAPPGRAELRYVTTMAGARRRVAAATAVIEATLPQVPMLADLHDLARWLESFHTFSRVELDYGGLAGMLAGTPVDETSVADLALGLAAVRAGDGAAAAAAYERVAGRWRDLQLRETAC